MLLFEEDEVDGHSDRRKQEDEKEEVWRGLGSAALNCSYFFYSEQIDILIFLKSEALVFFGGEFGQYLGEGEVLGKLVGFGLENEAPFVSRNRRAIIGAGVELVDLQFPVVGRGDFETVNGELDQLVEWWNEPVSGSPDLQGDIPFFFRLALIEDHSERKVPVGSSRGLAAGINRDGCGCDGKDNVAGGIEEIEIDLKWWDGVDFRPFWFEKEVGIWGDGPSVLGIGPAGDF